MWVDEDFILSSPGHFGFLEHFLGSVLEQFLVQLGMGVFAQGIGLPVGHFIRVAVHLFVWGWPQHILEFLDTFWNLDFSSSCNGHFRAWCRSVGHFIRARFLIYCANVCRLPFIDCLGSLQLAAGMSRNDTEHDDIDDFDDEEDAFNFLDC